jgi:hypothetical protein
MKIKNEVEYDSLNNFSIWFRDWLENGEGKKLYNNFLETYLRHPVDVVEFIRHCNERFRQKNKK